MGSVLFGINRHAKGVDRKYSLRTRVAIAGGLGIAAWLVMAVVIGIGYIILS